MDRPKDVLCEILEFLIQEPILLLLLLSVLILHHQILEILDHDSQDVDPIVMSERTTFPGESSHLIE